MRRTLLLACLLSTPVTAMAQNRFELTPFAGLRSGGSFRAPERDLALDVQSSLGGGVIFDYVLNDTMQIELLWSHQSSDLDIVDVSPVPGDGSETPPDGTEDFPSIGIGVDYFHGAFVYGGGSPVFRPYVLIGAGVARLSPDLPDVSSTSKFSFSVGTGFKSFFTERFGLRVDARAFGTRAGDQREDVACGVFGCVSFETAATFWQGQVVGGFIVAF